MSVLPGLILSLLLALGGWLLADFVGVKLLVLPQSPVSPIMMAILLGILLRNTLGYAKAFEPGIQFSLVRILRLGIVLLGIRLSLGEAGEIGLKALPVIVICVASALIMVTWLSKKMGLSGRLGTLIAAGTGICGATAIVALAPSIQAKDDETSYAVACITLFGVLAMLTYPFIAYALFDGDAFKAGLFMGTSVHETAQVAGAGLVYQQYFSSNEALNVATVTKLVRNLGMLVVIPLMCVLYHREGKDGETRPTMWSMIPLFVIGFALMSLLRTVGDMGDRAFGLLEPDDWRWLVSMTKYAAEICLGIAMAAVGLGTSLSGIREIGVKPLAAGFFSAALVGVISFVLISLLY